MRKLAVLSRDDRGSSMHEPTIEYRERVRVMEDIAATVEEEDAIYDDSGKMLIMHISE